MENISVWIKALTAAAVTGFSGAALDALTTMVASGSVDYKAAVHAGIASAIIGVLAYLKASPIPAQPVI
jgi:hypothetical protein